MGAMKYLGKIIKGPNPPASPLALSLVEFTQPVKVLKMLHLEGLFYFVPVPLCHANLIESHWGTKECILYTWSIHWSWYLQQTEPAFYQQIFFSPLGFLKSCLGEKTNAGSLGSVVNKWRVHQRLFHNWFAGSHFIWAILWLPLAWETGCVGPACPVFSMFWKARQTAHRVDDKMLDKDITPGESTFQGSPWGHCSQCARCGPREKIGRVSLLPATSALSQCNCFLNFFFLLVQVLLFSN